MRDIETIDSELRLVVLRREAARERGPHGRTGDGVTGDGVTEDGAAEGGPTRLEGVAKTRRSELFDLSRWFAH
jgi:hypothetical protein